MRKIAAILVLVLGSLALLGADGGTYKGGTYGTSGATYQAGGGARMTTTSVISRSALYPNTNALAAMIAAGYATVVDTALATKNSADNGTSVRWGWVRKDQPTTVQKSSTAGSDYSNWSRPHSSEDDHTINTSQRYALFWFSANGVQAGSQIVQARVAISVALGFTISGSTTFKARLVTVGSDYSILNGGTSGFYGSNNDAGGFDCTWDNTSQRLATPWSPDLDDRDDYSDWGLASPTTFGAGTYSTGQDLIFDFKDAVQQVVDDAVFDESLLDRGFLVLLYGTGGTSESSQNFTGGNAVSQIPASGGNPLMFVKARAASSQASLSIPTPAYYALWFQDPGASLSSSTLDSLAAFDMVVTGPFPMEGTASEPAYATFVSDLRSRNEDIIVLMYAHPWYIRQDGAAGANRAPYRRVLAWANSLADSAGWAHTQDFAVAWSKSYPTTGVINFMRAGAADSMARIWVDGYITATGVNAEYTGLFVDDAVANLRFYDYYLSWGTGEYADIDQVLDVDQDGTEYASDADERAAYRQYLDDFFATLRSEFLNRGLSKRLIVANSDLGMASSPSDMATSIMAQIDGFMNEGPNQWVPGSNAADSTWTRVLAAGDLLTNAQVSPPLVLYNVKADSSIAYMSEPIGLASGGWVCANGDLASWGYGNTGVPPMVRRLPASGSIYGATFQDGGAGQDTMTVASAAYTARIVVGRNSGDTSNEYAVWPYIVFSATSGETLSVSSFW